MHHENVNYMINKEYFMSKLILPKVIGHRGAKAYAPENTLASIRAAADLGIEWVEVDVKLTKDGTAVLFHDETLERCTSGSGPVAGITYAELAELDAGSWFGESFIGERVPTLEEALNVVIDLGLGINLEIKSCPGREVETAEVMLDVATRLWPDNVAPPLVSSFSHVSLEAAFDMMPDWPRGFLMDEHIAQWKDMAEHLDAATININGNKVTEALVSEYLNLRKPVLAYTINDAARAKMLFGWGVASVFSDCPDVIRAEVESFH